MTEMYLPFVRGGRWAISREIGGRWIALVQDSYLDDPHDAVRALEAVGLRATAQNLDTYFPIIGARGRCPTLEFLERFSRLGTAIKKEVGV